VWDAYCYRLRFQLAVFRGLATILYYIFKLPASIGILFLNIPAFIVTWKVIGFKYGAKSLIGMISCSAGIVLAEHFGELTNDFVLAALYGGIVSRHRHINNL